ncbi:MAG: Thermostable beta-glucosidase B [Promethearchaeota archaeon]|nr:MAG: Thermostable beta-glucosidase B [Candidatus Lokiarchaeota archaeon]
MEIRKYSEEELKALPFMNSNLSIEERVEDLLIRLTLEEKFKLLTGRHRWETSPIKRLGIKPFLTSDGPNGVAPHSSNYKEATYFPVGICRASTWNRELCYEFGKALASETREVGAHMILAPGVNIIRTPMCGRNFEYQTEDPYLNKELTVPFIKGVQEERIAACVKHYICNNQETNRFTYNALVSQRALEEIYFPAFKAAVEEANVFSAMGAYNKINGFYACEHDYLLKKILIEKWGFKGFVVSDWNATQYIERPEDALNAYLTLEMPRARIYKRRNLQEAFEEQRFTIDVLDENIRRLLRVMFFVGLFDAPESLPKGYRNIKAHQNLARKMAEEGIVLLKNENKILPLEKDKIQKIAIIGPNADKQMSEGGGSSSVRPPYDITPYQGLKEKCGDHISIVNDASKADFVFLVLGLNHEPGNDCENADRSSYKLPKEQIDLIHQTTKANPKTIIILINGTPVSMTEWINMVPALIEVWYPGMEGGRALADIIFGEVNPSGKLPVTFPKKLSDSPAHKSELSYPGDNEKNVHYDEDIFVGYRYFDTEDIEPLYPFGYGLSYTEFTYDNLRLDKKVLSENDILTVEMDIINSGIREGAEVVQLYIHDVGCSIKRPEKELKGFTKIKLTPNQRETLSFHVKKENLMFYNENSDSWTIEEGAFKILIGPSSRDIRLEGDFQYKTK